MQISVEAVTTAPQKTAFEAVTDIANWPRFISAIEHVEVLTPGSLQPGTRFRETRSIFGRRTTEEMTVADIDPPHRLVLTAFAHGTEYRAEHTFEPEGSRTLMTLVFQGLPVATSARLLAPLGWLLLGIVKRQLVTDLADLAREAERRHRADTSSAA